MILWTILPFYSLIVTSLSVTGSIGDLLPKKITFAFFRDVITNRSGMGNYIWPHMRNSIIVSVITTIIVLVLSLPCAYGLSRLKSKSSKRIYMGVFILRCLPPIGLVIPWYFIIKSINLYDTYTGLIIVYVFFQIPLGIWLMKGFFDTIPIEIEESALVDGASVFQTFRKIIMPLSSNGIAVTASFILLYVYLEYMYASMLTSLKTVTMPVFIVGFISPFEVRYQLMLAAALVGIIPTTIIFILAQRYLVSGITGGALKQ
jgi:ABC-type glycerol-3-phosphate transport system permease component